MALAAAFHPIKIVKIARLLFQKKTFISKYNSKLNLKEY